MQALAYSAAQILAIPLLEPERLFGTPDDMGARYHALARKWHTDMGGDQAVISHINALHTRAKHLIDVGQWHVPGLFEFTASGKQYRVHYLRAFDFELGKAFIGKTLVTYVITKDFADLAANARKRIEGLRFPDHKTEEVMRRYLPKIVQYHETPSDVVIAIDKPADLIRARDLLDHFHGKLDTKHVAWVISRMLNHASYLETVGLTHNDLSLDSIFVCPEHHSICLLGGWWYATPVNELLTMLPTRTHALVPSDILAIKRASLRLDPMLVRLTGRELLGDPSGVRLASDPDVRKPIANWLRLSGTGSAVQDYTQWRDHVLGPRKFVKLSISASDVYTELGR